MSLSFTQITELIDTNCHSNSTSYPTAKKVVDINVGMDYAFSDIFKASGTWQFDDTNHTDYPFITTNLVSGQRDYTFTTDESGNLILDIYRVMVKNQDGYFNEIFPVDQESDSGMASFYDGRNTQGTPNRYDKTANGIFLDAIPSYSQTNGLKVFINREGSYFTTSDTTKKPGFAGLYHSILVLYASKEQCKRMKMFDLADRYEKDWEKMRLEMKKYYMGRTKDEALIITSQTINSI